MIQQIHKHQSNEFKEFSKKVRRVHDKRHCEIINSYGVYDYYKHYRKNKPKDKIYVMEDVFFYKIIKDIHDLIIENILQGEIIKFPLRMGKIFLVESLVGVHIKNDGTLKNYYQIDWNKTLQLWFEDEEAFLNKTLIRDTEDKVRIFYSKNKVNFKNKTYYQFHPTRKISTYINKIAKQKNIHVWKNPLALN